MNLCPFNEREQGMPGACCARREKAEYFFAGDRMTKISLKMFNKLPLTRNEIGNLSRAGRAAMWFYPAAGVEARRAG
jgi:hypothetical protein